MEEMRGDVNQMKLSLSLSSVGQEKPQDPTEILLPELHICH